MEFTLVVNSQQNLEVTVQTMLWKKEDVLKYMSTYDSSLLFFRQYFLTMPRSNKKKKQTYQPAVPSDDHAVAQLLGKEKTTMVTRAIVSV